MFRIEDEAILRVMYISSCLSRAAHKGSRETSVKLDITTSSLDLLILCIYFHENQL